MVEDGLVLSMATIMSEQEDFGRLCATVRDATDTQTRAYALTLGMPAACLPLDDID